MKISYRLLLALCLPFAASNALAEQSYQVIYRVKLSSDGFYKEFSEVKPFYEDRMKEEDALDGLHTAAERGSDREFLGIDTFDLNEDGQKEIFVSIGNQLECGSHGCTFDIYEIDSNGQLRVLYSGIAEAPIILNSISHHYHDLVFSGSEKGESFYRIYRFDGEHYVQAERISADKLQ